MPRIKANHKRLIVTNEESFQIYYVLKTLVNKKPDTTLSKSTQCYHIDTTMCFNEDEIEMLNSILRKMF